jgi:phage shock protein A
MAKFQKRAGLRGRVLKLAQEDSDMGAIATAIQNLESALEVHASQIGKLNQDVTELRRKISALLKG